MFRKLTLSIAIATACAFGSSAVAQTNGAQTNGAQTNGAASMSTTPKVELASYGANYSSGCVGCGQGGGSSAYGGGYGNYGGPQAMAYGQAWGGAASSRDCSRFYHYPYVYYPQNFRGSEYYQSSDSMYNRYPPEMQIPVYNKQWHNYYPSSRRYHWGHQFILDVF